jgi:hypothetical protein
VREGGVTTRLTTIIGPAAAHTSMLSRLPQQQCGMGCSGEQRRRHSRSSMRHTGRMHKVLL